jgi:uncharacterized protein (UPF0276 family)
MRRGGPFAPALADIAARIPVLPHGLAMSLGGDAPFDPAYMADLRAFLVRYAAPWHSDHLCFSGAEGRVLHDLLPLPYNLASARRVAARIVEASEALGRPVAFENVSAYVELGASEMSEAEFIREVASLADCPILLDVNNAWVNAHNFDFDVMDWLATIPLERVVQLHVAGHEPWAEGSSLLIDTHGAPTRAEVAALMAWVVERTGPLPVVLERDNAIPPLAALVAEVQALTPVYDRAVEAWRARRPERLA